MPMQKMTLEELIRAYFILNESKLELVKNYIYLIMTAHNRHRSKGNVIPFASIAGGKNYV